jgi:hypothetical protein
MQLPLCLGTAALLCAACGGNVTQPLDREGQQGVLEVQPPEGGAFRGRYVEGEHEIRFQSVERDGAVYEIQVELNGLVLDALVDAASGVSQLDGFAGENGGDTQMAEADRELLAPLYRALNEQLPADGLTGAARYLRRAVGLWAQHPSSVSLSRTVMGEEGRGYTMLCSYARCNGSYTGSCSGLYNWYSYARHDCNKGGFSYERNQQIAQLGDHYSCSGDEWYSTDGISWTCGEPDHWYRPKVVGNCFGRCGGGCGGDTQYTLDATNHDGCVRNGHALASLYCDDQFTSASDDELFAPDCY